MKFITFLVAIGNLMALFADLKRGTLNITYLLSALVLLSWLTI